MRSALVIAGLTLRRLVRGRAVWVSGIIAGLPVAFASAIRAQRRHEANEIDILVFVMLLFVILPAMFVASSVGEDIEDRTTTYLWSRPVPRWAVLAGKLLALAPLTAAFIVGSWVASVVAGAHDIPTALSCIALAGGAVAMCFVAAAIATFVPKHGMPLAISYVLFFDGPVGLMPISLAKLSITHHVRTLANVFPSIDEHPSSGAIGLAVLAVVWLAIALVRFRRLEA